MSYPPQSFRETDDAKLKQQLGAVTLGLLITQAPEGPIATHLPMLFDADAGERGLLLGHVAKSNPHGKASGATALVVFQGPDAYISPSYYETKKTEPRVVPTWNYKAIHVRGTLETFDDADQLYALVARLTKHHEARVGASWQITDAPEDYMARMLRGIVGLRVRVTSIEGRAKLSQNRQPQDQASVAQALGASDDANERDLAGLMGKPTG
jgi:transcriptional regulator